MTTRTSKQQERGGAESPSSVSYYRKIMNHQPSFVSESQIVTAIGKAALEDSDKIKRESIVNMSKNRDSILNQSIN